MYSKLFYILVFVLGNSLLSIAQNTTKNDDFKDKLTGKRWGLSYFIEQNGNLYDTLIRVHDCQNEYRSFFKNCNRTRHVVS